MQLRLSDTIRGVGKIFLHLVADVGEDVARVRASSFIGTNELPVRVIPAPAGVDGWVLVLPLTQATQRLVVRAYDLTGQLLRELHETIAHDWAKRRSQMNTILRNQTACAMRNCDERLPLSELTECRVTNLIDRGKTEVIRLELTLRAYERASDLAGDVQVMAQDKEGVPLAVAPQICLGDTVLPEQEVPATFFRRITFSLEIRTGASFVRLWVRFDVESRDDLVVTLDESQLKQLREDWFYLTLSADRDPIYDQWYRERHRAKAWQLEGQRRAFAAGRLGVSPLFSVVVPLYDTPLDYLRQMVASVLAQTYGRLELILVIGSPDNGELVQLAERYARRDERVHVVALDANRGIVGNTNAGIERAEGDFVGFLDHDDVIEPDLLMCYVEGLATHPQTDLFYCDEDKLVDGRYEQVYLKPDWSPDLLRSLNYVCHLLCVRTSLVRELGGLRERFEGAQDYDLTLQVGERARNVYHARRVLYHWRASAESTAHDASAKSYARAAGLHALQEHLDRVGIAAKAVEDADVPNLYHLRFDIMSASSATGGHSLAQPPLVSIVIPNKDSVTLLAACIASIFERSSYTNFEIVVVENESSSHETFDYYHELQAAHDNVRVVTYLPDTSSFNFAAIMNYGIAQARGEYVLMLNNDTRVITSEWIEFLLGHARQDDVGCVGAKLLYPDDTIQHAGVIIHRGGPNHTGIFLPRDSQNYFHSAQVCRNFLGVTGACLMVRKATFDRVGGLDEAFAADYNDVDFCLRVYKAGYWNVYEPQCELYHLESVSRGKNETRERALRFRHEKGILADRWPRYHEFADPFMHPCMWAINPYWHLDV